MKFSMDMSAMLESGEVAMTVKVELCDLLAKVDCLADVFI